MLLLKLEFNVSPLYILQLQHQTEHKIYALFSAVLHLNFLGFHSHLTFSKLLHMIKHNF